MKTLFSILTASAAGFMAIGAASAADLPSKKAAPAQYVKICDAYGAGYFYIPGSDTCLKIGGYVRAEYRLRSHPLAADNESFFRARGLIALDAKTKTSYGDLHTVVQFRMTDDTGQAGTATFIPNAYIEFAGITAGRKLNSFFDFYAHDYEHIGVTTSSDQAADVLAYTAKFGGGFSATVSLENAVWREQNGNSALQLGSIVNGTKVVAGTSYDVPGKIGYLSNGTRMPEIVGVLRADGTWGSAQLSGVAHQINANLTSLAPPPFTTTANVSKIGYAIQAGAKINLPMLAAGDTVLVQVAYAKGAYEYINSNDISGAWANGAHVSVPLANAAQSSATTIALSKAWAITAGFEHYWTPTLRSAVFGSYMDYKAPNTGIVASVYGGSKLYDAKVYVIGTRLMWSPVKNLLIGPEITYENVKLGRISATTDALPAISKGSDIRAAFRIQANF